MAVAALTGADRPHHQDEQAETLRLLSEHQDELVRRRTQVINRLHVLLSHLLDGGASASLTADHAARLLGRIRHAPGAQATRRAVAVELVAEIRHLDKKSQGSFQPQIVPKHSRRVEGFDEAIISLDLPRD